MKNQIKKTVTKGALTIESVTADKYNDERMSAQLRQMTTTISEYPSKGGSDKQSSLLTGSGESFKKESLRVCFVPVDLGSTKESVSELIASLPDATIYQIVSTDIQDVLTDGHRYQIEEGGLLLEDLEEKYSIPVKNKAGDLTSERVSDDEGNTIYRAVYFSADGQEDINHLVSISEAVSENIESEGEVA